MVELPDFVDRVKSPAVASCHAIKSSLRRVGWRNDSRRSSYSRAIRHFVERFRLGTIERWRARLGFQIRDFLVWTCLGVDVPVGPPYLGSECSGTGCTPRASGTPRRLVGHVLHRSSIAPIPYGFSPSKKAISRSRARSAGDWKPGQTTTRSSHQFHHGKQPHDQANDFFSR